MPNSLSGKSWIHIRISGDSQNGGLKKMAARITRAPEEIFVKNYYQAVLKIVFQARQLMRQIIRESTTPTGAERAAKGKGESGRIDTAKMIDAVWARVSKPSKDKYRAEVGWLTGRPGYAIFQEYGTRNGIKGMGALQQASDYIAREMDKLGKGGSKYTRNVQWDWKSTPGEAPDWLVT